MTAVIGKNGVGKSSLFDAFGFLADCLKLGVEETGSVAPMYRASASGSGEGAKTRSPVLFLDDERRQGRGLEGLPLGSLWYSDYLD